MQKNVISQLDSLNFEPVTDSESEMYDFINDIKNNEHSILLFQTNQFRDKIVNNFIDKSKNSVYTACFTNELSKYSCNKSITYEELIENKTLKTQKVSDFLITVLDEAYPTYFPRVACENTSWFSEVGFFEEHQKLGDKIDKKIINESAILCCYDITKLNDDQISTVLQSRAIVILEDTMLVYKKNS